MLEEERKQGKMSKVLSLAIKIAITVICFWYIAYKIDFTAAVKAITRAEAIYLLAGLLLFILSKIFSAIRLNLYFRNIGLQLDPVANLRLYWLGMFYNLFLPGAISGDAYKVILLKRKYGLPYKKLAAAVLVDRLSGVLALGLILCGYGIVVLNAPEINLALVVCAVAGIAGFYLGIRFWFRDFLSSFLPTFFWGLLVQCCQVVCVYCILQSLHLPLQHEWILIFLASAIITILPVTLGGGLGTREVVFAEGARYCNLDPQTGVAISLLFYLITVTGSLWGLVYNFRDPLNKDQHRSVPA